MSNFEQVVFAPNDVVPPESFSYQERRKRVRTTVHWPILFFRNDASDGIESTTQNLSSTGFYCLSQTRFDLGESLFCTLRIPSHDPEAKDRLWILECRVRVTRSEPRENLYGVACEFEDYRISHQGLARF
jgi:c-di-GMP-binding flagellar brake protein YcgR